MWNKKIQFFERKIKLLNISHYNIELRNKNNNWLTLVDDFVERKSWRDEKKLKILKNKLICVNRFFSERKNKLLKTSKLQYQQRIRNDSKTKNDTGLTTS